MARKKAAAAPPEEGLLAQGDVNYGEAEEVLTSLRLAPEGAEPLAPAEPEPTEPGWEAFVLSQFQPGELADGCPRVHGLVRVAEKLLGPLKASVSRVAQAPTFLSADCKRWQPAVVEHTAVFLYMRDKGVAPYEVTFSGVADSHHGNTDTFGRYATAMAETRAKARAFRAALRLSKVSAEEKCDAVPELSEGIDRTQSDLIDLMCQRLDVDAWCFVNSGNSGASYAKLADVPYEKAQEMVRKLDFWQKNEDKVPARIKGYRGDWREKA